MTVRPVALVVLAVLLLVADIRFFGATDASLVSVVLGLFVAMAVAGG